MPESTRTIAVDFGEAYDATSLCVSREGEGTENETRACPRVRVSASENAATLSLHPKTQRIACNPNARTTQPTSLFTRAKAALDSEKEDAIPLTPTLEMIASGSK